MAYSVPNTLNILKEKIFPASWGLVLFLLATINQGEPRVTRFLTSISTVLLALCGLAPEVKPRFRWSVYILYITRFVLGRFISVQLPETAWICSQQPCLLLLRAKSSSRASSTPTRRHPVTEPPNYTRLSRKIIQRKDNLTNLSPYNPVVREISADFKPFHITSKIVLSLAVTIISYIKVCGIKYIRV
jgi:hypothetical protein